MEKSLTPDWGGHKIPLNPSPETDAVLVSSGIVALPVEGLLSRTCRRAAQSQLPTLRAVSSWPWVLRQPSQPCPRTQSCPSSGKEQSPCLCPCQVLAEEEEGTGSHE